MALITLTTDLGTSDYYVGKLKGCLLKHNSQNVLIDISHQIPLHDIAKAAYFVRSSYGTFPPGTIHLVSVYNAYNPSRQHLLYSQDGHYFILPDNGIIALLFDDINHANVKAIIRNENLSSNFELFGHIIACIQNELLQETTKPIEEFTQKISVQPVLGKAEIRGTIIHVDHMENVITNVSRSLFDKQRDGRAFEIYFRHNNPITQISQYYSDVPVGEVLCLFNDSDMLEIAINMGKASSMLDLYNNETIQIYFL